jgi:glycosyltransferase involved in cell wall biosynthesis
LRVHVEYSHSFDPLVWQERYAAGLVPDRLPYGLDRLEQHGFELELKPPPGRVLGVLDGVTRRATGGFEFVHGALRGARQECDLSLCWDERTGVPSALRSKLRGKPATATGVIWVTEPDAPIGRRGRFVVHRLLRRAAAVWAMSPAQLVVLERDFAIPSRRLHLLHMGIDVDFWRIDGFEPEPNLVIGAGNDRHRDHALLLDAMKRLHRIRPTTRFELITDHPVKVPPELGRTHSHLAHPQMREMYARTSVVALALKPNLHVSGLSVLLEAMACERPVVITNSPGLSEYVRDGETAIVVPPGDPDALACGIGDLLADSDRARAIGAAAKAFVRRFSTGRQAEVLGEILRTAI